MCSFPYPPQKMHGESITLDFFVIKILENRLSKAQRIGPPYILWIGKGNGKGRNIWNEGYSFL